MSPARCSLVQFALGSELKAALQTCAHSWCVVDDLFGPAARAYHRVMRSGDGAAMSRTDLVYRIFVSISLELHVHQLADVLL
jgi:hypothetical protein